MALSVLATRTVEFLLLPPGNLLPLLVLLFLLRKRSTWVKGLLVLYLLQLGLLSSPWVAVPLLDQLEEQYPVQAALWEQSPRPQAIVILGAGRHLNAVDYGGETTSLTGLERLRYAALLYRHTQLPILVTGGKPQPGKLSEAELMRDILEQEFNVPVRWLETDSHTTQENADFTDQILSQAGIESAWLVTEAWHMPRSMYAFSHKKVRYLPASASYGGSIVWEDDWTYWIPQANALSQSMVALHEYIGLGVYRLKQEL